MRKIIIISLAILSVIGCFQDSNSSFQEVPSAIPSRNSTLVPTSSLFPISSSTLTPEPKVIKTPIENKDEFTLELIKTNAQCHLPCWWGVTPNKTKWSKVKDFFHSFSIVNGRKTPDWLVYLVRSPIDEEISSVREIRSTFGVQDDIIKLIEIDAFNEKTYYLNNFLQSNGKPDFILVSSYSSDSGAGKDIVPLTVVLYYPKLGILALYGSWANVVGDKINACFDTGPKLFLWSPNSSGKYAIEDFLGWDKYHIPYRSIEDATNLTIETFYEEYLNTNGELCLKTPRDLWPSQ